MSHTLIIFGKELREVLRDRKTLIFMLALPVFLMPVILDVATRLVISAAREATTERLEYAIVGADHAPELAAAFEHAPPLVTDDDGASHAAGPFARVDLPGVETGDDDARIAAIKAAIVRGDIDFALVVEPAVGGGPGGPQITARLYYDNASSSSKAETRARAVIEATGRLERDRRLTALGVPAGEAQAHLLRPIAIDDSDKVRDMRAVIGEQAGGMLPYLFIAFCFLGALYPAIDLGAGEKERGTLETLLLVPVPRSRIVLGKFLVVFAAGTTAAVLCLVSLGVWLSLKGGELEGAIGAIIRAIGPLDLTLIGLMLIPTAAIFAAVLLSISIYAKSFKEAQSYAAPFQFVAILPAAATLLPGVELNWAFALVPITNISLAIKELVKGTIDYAMLAVILGSSAAIAAGMLAFCTWWFRRESVLFRH